ncbi:zinc ABC transporter substrate-binding protein [Oryzomonas japonica]|uniref:Zinc ABC transporter substrate-binding protein n=1 Tax=Oryzomonas japonica TaxID=2603858 RepID=A0A7J4ZUW9_9BACT|nr:metal ABC transporter substrate-binding protein [Oryzomonas japonica]KAB0667428.1 zinc ABC transporter substrate-binding protein [Oryzomonas japonica]
MVVTSLRTITVVILWLTVLPFAASAADGPIRVVGTVSPLSDIVRKIGGRQVVVSTVLAPGMYPSEYLFREGYLAKMKGTELVIRIGEGGDPWSDRLIAAIGARVPVINAARQEDLAVANRFSRSRESAAAGGPSIPQLYVWLDPRIVRDRIAPAVLQALVELRPARAAEFKRNSRRFFFELSKMDNETGALLAQMPPKPFMVQTGAWSFLFNRYGLMPVEVVVPDERTEISAERMSRMIARGRLAGVHLIFRNHRPPTRPLTQIAKRIDAALVPLGVMGNEHPDMMNGSYLELMQVNIKKLLMAFH